MSVDPKTPCDLCALEVGNAPLFIHAREKDLVFCCEGCVGIFRMINDVEEVEESGEKTSNATDIDC